MRLIQRRWALPSGRRRGASTTANTPNQRMPYFETLESRHLLAVDHEIVPAACPLTCTLAITADSNDAITIDVDPSDGTVRVNANSLGILPARITSFSVLPTGDFANQIRITSALMLPASSQVIVDGGLGTDSVAFDAALTTAGTVSIAAEAITLNATTVQAAGNITFSGPVSLGAAANITVTSTGGNVRFAGTINDSAPASTLSVSSIGSIEIVGPVGGTTAIAGLTASANTIDLGAVGGANPGISGGLSITAGTSVNLTGTNYRAGSVTIIPASVSTDIGVNLTAGAAGTNVALATTTAAAPISINGNVTLAGRNLDLTTNVGGVLLLGDVSGPGSFRATTGAAIARFGGFLGQTGAELSSLEINGTGAIELAGDSASTGDVSFNRPVSLIDDIVIEARNITFASTVDSESASLPRMLDVRTQPNGTKRFLGAIGAGPIGTIETDNLPLSRLITNGDGETQIGGRLIRLSGASATFRDPVVLLDDLSIIESGSGDVRFENSINSEATERNELSIHVPATSRTVFLGPVGMGLNQELGSLRVDGPALLDIADANDVRTIGDQEYDALTLAEDAVLIGNEFVFQGPIDSETSSVPRSLTITTVSLPGEVGDVTVNAPIGLGVNVSNDADDRPLALLTIDSAGTLAINASILARDTIELRSRDESSAAAPADQIIVATGVTIRSTTAAVRLLAGDAIRLNAGSVIRANGAATLNADALAGDLEAAGATIEVHGLIVAASVGVTTGNDEDTVILNQTAGTAATPYNTVVQTGALADTIRVRGVAVNNPTTVQGGTGDDEIFVSSAATETVEGHLDAILSEISIDGEAELNDSLVIDDRAPAQPNSIVMVTSTSVIGLANVTINYQRIERLSILAGGSGGGGGASGACGVAGLNVAVSSTSAATTLETGDGNDQVRVSSGVPGNLNAIFGDLTILSSGGQDCLTLDDSTSFTPNSLVQLLGANATTGNLAIVRGFAGPSDNVDIAFDGVERLRLDGNSRAERFFVHATEAATTINGGDGDDTVRLSAGDPDSAAGNLDAIDFSLTFNGQAGENDQLELDDASGNTDNAEVTVEKVPTAADRDRVTGFAGPTDAVDIIYDDVEKLILNGNAKGEVFRVRATSAQTTINAGGGDDTIYVSSLAPADGWLDEITRKLTIDGGTGTNDRLFLNDALRNPANVNNKNDNVVVTANQITGFAGPADDVPVEYQFLDRVTLQGDLGPGSDKAEQFFVRAIPLGTTLVVNAGDGSDRIDVGSVAMTLDDILGDLEVHGENHATGALNTIQEVICGTTVTRSLERGDILAINDVGSTATNRYMVSASSFRRIRIGAPASTTGTIFYGFVNLLTTVETIQVFGGKADDELRISSTPSEVHYEISLGDGADQGQVDTTGDASQVVLSGTEIVAATTTGTASAVKVVGTSDIDTITFDTTGGPLNNISSLLSVQAGAGDDIVQIVNTGVSSLTRVSAGDNRDSVFIVATGGGDATHPVSSTEISGEGHSDRIFVGTRDEATDDDATPGTLDGLLGNLCVNGNEHDTASVASLEVKGMARPLAVGDRLIVDDAASFTENTYDLTAATIRRNVTSSGIATGVIAYGQPGLPANTIETIELRTGHQNNRINVASTAANANTTLIGGSKEDRFRIETVGAQSNVLARGGAGADEFVLLSTPNESLVMAPYVVLEGEDDPDLIHAHFLGTNTRAALHGGLDNDEIRLERTQAGSVAELAGGAADDKFFLPSLFRTLSAFQGEVCVFGEQYTPSPGGPGVGKDMLFIDDRDDVQEHDYDITSTLLARDGVFPITYFSVELLELRMAQPTTTRAAAQRFNNSTTITLPQASLTQPSLPAHVRVIGSATLQEAVRILGTPANDVITLSDVPAGNPTVGAGNQFQVNFVDCLLILTGAGDDVVRNNTVDSSDQGGTDAANLRSVPSTMDLGDGNDVASGPQSGPAGTPIALDVYYGGGGSDFITASAAGTQFLFADYDIKERKTLSPGDVLDGNLNPNANFVALEGDQIRRGKGRIAGCGFVADIETWLFAQWYPVDFGSGDCSDSAALQVLQLARPQCCVQWTINIPVSQIGVLTNAVMHSPPLLLSDQWFQFTAGKSGALTLATTVVGNRPSFEFALFNEDFLPLESARSTSSTPMAAMQVTNGKVYNLRMRGTAFTSSAGDDEIDVNVSIEAPGAAAPQVNSIALGQAATSIVVFAADVAPSTVVWPVDRVEIQFSMPVVIDADDLHLTAALGGWIHPESTAFHYDVTSNKATWTLSQEVTNDVLTVTLSDDVRSASGIPLVFPQSAVQRSLAPAMSNPTWSLSLVVMAGDANGDGITTFVDVIAVRNAMGAGAAGARFDMNGDGTVDLADVAAVAKYALKTSQIHSTASPASIIASTANSDRRERAPAAQQICSFRIASARAISRESASSRLRSPRYSPAAVDVSLAELVVGRDRLGWHSAFCRRADNSRSPAN